MKIAFIRHGEFNKGETHLNSLGIDQIKSLVPALEAFNHPKVFSSLGPRSRQSAKIIAQALGTTFEAKKIFGANHSDDRAVLYPDALKFISELKSDVVIVSKGEYLDDFIVLFAKTNFGQAIPWHELKRGQGMVLSSAGYERLG